MHLMESIGGCLPSPRQTVFLKACIGEPAAALKAWEEWTAHDTLDEIDQDYFRMLPLLYRNLQDAGCTSPEMPRLKGLYRRNWYTNQKLFHAIERVVVKFQERGIPTLLLKGAALSFSCYPDAYARTMLDGDVMVPLDRADEAMALLREEGWKLDIPLKKNHLTTSHSGTFIDGGGHVLDLLWHLFAECCNAGADDVFWRQAVPLQFRSVRLKTLAPTHQLLHACIHGYQWNFLHPMRWVADAGFILRKDGAAVDWDALVDLAQARRFTLRLARGLAFLRQSCGMAIPEKTLAALRVIPISRFERREHDILTREGRLRSDPRTEFIWPVMKMWCLHQRLHPDQSGAVRMATFPAMVSEELHLGGVTRLPIVILGRAVRKLREKTGTGSAKAA
jgi:hypothetical protein